MLGVAAPSANAQKQTAKIAVSLSLTGANESSGSPELDGVRLTVEEANAAGGVPTIELSVNDDASSIDVGKELAHRSVPAMRSWLSGLPRGWL